MKRDQNAINLKNVIEVKVWKLVEEDKRTKLKLSKYEINLLTTTVVGT